jgi:hypothetical protein
VFCAATSGAGRAWARFHEPSDGHIHGERKIMTVCDCHDFAAFAGFEALLVTS